MAATDDLDEETTADRAAKDTYEGRQRLRREPSTVREVTDSKLTGRYLCLDCGFLSPKADHAHGTISGRTVDTPTKTAWNTTSWPTCPTTYWPTGGC